MDQQYEIGEVVVFQFGPTEWVAEVIEGVRNEFVRDHIQPAIKVRLDRAQFGKYENRAGDAVFVPITDVIAR